MPPCDDAFTETQNVVLPPVGLNQAVVVMNEDKRVRSGDSKNTVQ